MTEQAFYESRPDVLPDVLPSGSIYSRRYKLLEPAKAQGQRRYAHVANLDIETGTITQASNSPHTWGADADNIDWTTVPLTESKQEMKRSCYNSLGRTLCCHDAGHDGHHEPQTTGNRIGWFDMLTAHGQAKLLVAICADDTPKIIADNIAAACRANMAAASAIQPSDVLSRGTIGFTITNADDCKPIMVNKAFTFTLEDVISARDTMAKANVPKFGYHYEVRSVDYGPGQDALAKDDDRRASCRWCKSPTCKTDAGSYCSGYQRCLEQRIARGGANDCEEERASVVRWCEAQRATWPNPFRDAPALCSECPAEKAIAATHQSSRGKPFCVYCYDRYAKEPVALILTEESVAARARNEAALAAERPRPTQQTRELAKGHPSSWPSVEGEDP